MIPLVRYQAALLVRSQRWVPPALLYAALVAIGSGGAGSQPLSDGLSWSAAMLVPAVAWLTRSMLTAGPDAARACVSAASGPRRAHLAALIAALAGGVILAVVGAAYTLARCHRPPSLAGTIGVLAAGLATAGVCLLVGGAIGAFCNPPLVRRPAYAILGTTGAVILALVSDVSPPAPRCTAPARTRRPSRGCPDCRSSWRLRCWSRRGRPPPCSRPAAAGDDSRADLSHRLIVRGAGERRRWPPTGSSAANASRSPSLATPRADSVARI